MSEQSELPCTVYKTRLCHVATYPYSMLLRCTSLPLLHPARSGGFGSSPTWPCWHLIVPQFAENRKDGSFKGPGFRVKPEPQ